MTQLTLDAPGQHLFIRSLGDEGILVGERHYTRSLIIGRTELLEDWAPQTPAELLTGSFGPVFGLEPELVLLGTGAHQVFPAPAELADFHRRQVGIEIMTTDAACRTFNVLVTEGRNVVAALLPLEAKD